jgi:hypothetical protein
MNSSKAKRVMTPSGGGSCQTSAFTSERCSSTGQGCIWNIRSSGRTDP